MAEEARLESYRNRRAWLAARRTGVGGSDAAAIVGVDPWKSELQVYAEKLGGMAEEAGEEATWGLLFQRPVARHYAAQTRRKLARLPAHHLHRSVSTPWLIGSVDGLIESVPDWPGQGVLEVKCTGFYRARQLQEEFPLYWQVQVQHYLAVLGLEWASIAVLSEGRKFLWLDMERNQRFIAVLLEREAEFWRQVKSKSPPDPDASESARDALSYLYPQETVGTAVDLPVEAVSWDENRTRGSVLVAEGEALKNESEAKIKAAMGEAEIGMLPTGVKYSWRSQRRKGYAVKESIFRVLRRRE